MYEMVLAHALVAFRTQWQLTSWSREQPEKIMVIYLYWSRVDSLVFSLAKLFVTKTIASMVDERIIGAILTDGERL